MFLKAMMHLVRGAVSGAVGFGVLGGIISGGLKEWLENGIRLLVVVVDDVHEVVRAHHLVDQLSRG